MPSLRLLPIVLPHELIEHLQKSGHLAEAALSLEACREYWQHASKYMEWGPGHSASAAGRHHPMYLYGDDARVNNWGDKLIFICLGMVLDSRRHSMMTHFPLVVVKEAGKLKMHVRFRWKLSMAHD